MAKRCSVCDHTSRDEIEMVMMGEDAHEIADLCRKSDITRSSYYWHKKHHLKNAITSNRIMHMQELLTKTLEILSETEDKLKFVHERNNKLQEENQRLVGHLYSSKSRDLDRFLGVMYFVEVPSMEQLNQRRRKLAK